MAHDLAIYEDACHAWHILASFGHPQNTAAQSPCDFTSRTRTYWIDPYADTRIRATFPFPSLERATSRCLRVALSREEDNDEKEKEEKEEKEGEKEKIE